VNRTCFFCGSPPIYTLRVYWSVTFVKNRRAYKICKSCYDRRDKITEFIDSVSMRVEYLDGSKVMPPTTVEDQFKARFKVLRDS
jgi:hypothetical protein